MSVEETRGAVIAEAYNVADARTFDAMLDRLVLEVQAEMPCARSCCDDDQLMECLSCQAREKLADGVAKVPV